MATIVKTIVLKKPVQHGDLKIEKLEFREIVAKDLRKVKISDNMEMGDIMEVARQACGQPPSVIDALCPKDILEVVAYVGNELDDGPKTGQSSFHS